MKQAQGGNVSENKGHNAGVPKAAPRKRIRRGFLLSRKGMAARLLNPANWSLKGRFLYVPAMLLVLGNLILIGFLFLVLEHNLDYSATRQLAMMSSQVRTRLGDARRFMSGHAASVSALETVQRAMAASDRAALRELMMPQLVRVRHDASMAAMNMDFVVEPDVVLLRLAGSQGAATGQDAGPLATMVVTGRVPASGLEAAATGLVIKGVAPVFHGDQHLGAVAVWAPMAGLLDSLDMPPEYGLAVITGNGGDILRKGVLSSSGPLPDLTPDDPPLAVGDLYYSTVVLRGGDGRQAGQLVLAFDASLLSQAKWSRINQFSWFFISGALVLWLFLYANVVRIERFLSRLKKIIISSHSNYFAERFESDHVHCLDVMNCHNEECPVYQNPQLVCYLETGSEAISPVWRNTCIFLNKYEECANCPVYMLRKGDELAEARNVINTMMRLWSGFLSRVGHLLAYVLRAQESTGQLPSLDEISKRLEQMAKLTFFSRDVQGVLDKQEIYQQLGHVFSREFGIKRFMLFEVDQDASSVEFVMDAAPGEPLCRNTVLMSPEACRADRTAEDVCSNYNPVLCPHFNIDDSKENRCCLPVVMGGHVGAVFSFVTPRRDWERVRALLPVLRKYLDEAAPVLSSLKLLRLSKEQALRDPLTRCHNRRFLDEFITKYEPLSEREERRTGFVMADLDFFKQVNDTHGHEAGDAVLKQVVQIMEGSIRRGDLLIRYGGEEFLMLLQNVDKGSAVAVAEKIRDRVEQHAFVLPGGGTLHKTISLGVAEFPDDAQTMYKAIKFADVALYQAKETGRNKVVPFTADMWTDEEY